MKKLILFFVILIFGCSNITQPMPKYKSTENEIKSSTQSNNKIIGKWIDIDGMYIISETEKGVSIKTSSKKGISIQMGTISKTSNGRQVNYNNNFGYYYIIYDNGNLGLCDDMSCFKSLKPIK